MQRGDGRDSDEERSKEIPLKIQGVYTLC